jgi:transposase
METKMKAKFKQSKTLKLFAGVDLHNENFYVHIIDQDERKCDSRKVPTTEEDVRKYFEPFRGLDIAVAVEIGNPTFWFCDILEDMGIEYFIVNTLEYQRTSNSKKKNDKRDARNLAFDLKRKNLPKVAVFKPNPTQRQLRTLITHRHQYVKDRVRTTNRTYSFLSSRGIKVKKRSLRDSLKYWEGLFALLKEQDPFISAELRLYHQDFKRLTGHIKDIEHRIHQLIKAHYLDTYNRLNTVPGIGFVIASALIALVGDWSRFKSSKKIVGYLGLASATRETADRKLKGHGAITKEGSSLMRSYLIQGGLCIIRSRQKKTIPLQRWYENIRIRKGWKKARVALVRKVCEIIFAMIRNGTDYDPLLLTKNSKPAL